MYWRTYIGKPIEYDEHRTAEELKELVWIVFDWVYGLSTEINDFSTVVIFKKFCYD